MRRLVARPASVTRLVAIGQLACVGVGTLLLIRLWQESHTVTLLALFACAAIGGVLTIFGNWAMHTEQRTAAELTRRVHAEQQLAATLEEAVANRTAELEEAQRVLQRMWRLGQQIGVELHPQHVLDRFLEAVCDVARANGGIVGLLSDSGMVRIAVGTGVGRGLTGMSVPASDSAMGRVIRSGVAWTVADVHAHLSEIAGPILAPVSDQVRGTAIVPITRRGERIGAVVVGTSEVREFTPVEIERIATMGDLLAVSLENAELVETLRQTEWRFRTLFRSAPDAVFTILESGRIREANEAVRDITGREPLQAIGVRIIELVDAADREAFEAALATTFAGNPSRLEVRFSRETGEGDEPRVVALAMTRLPEADPPTVLLVGRDTTAERAMRASLMASDRLAAIGELVAGVAHEVNNPLSSISAFAQLLLRDGGLSSAQRDSIEVIKSETLRASQVVKDLLAFARRSDPLREPLDLNGVVLRTLRLRGYQMASSRIDVQTELASALPQVVGDPRQLQQVCLNLITNAAQAMTPLGGGTLVVSTRLNGNQVVLDVRDTGPGIPERARTHIFEPFFTTKREGEGTGLGLSVSYGIIAAHGGTIEVADSSTAGTTLRVTLPVAAFASTEPGPGGSGDVTTLSAVRLNTGVSHVEFIS